MKKLLYLKLFGLVAILAVALVFIGVNSIEGQMTTQDKPPKPPGKVTTERIVFKGDLEGDQAVTGCCPNAGPSPAYTMRLPNGVGCNPSTGECHIQPGTYYGYIFLNVYGAGEKTDRQYMVQFGTEYCEVAMKIIGGVIDFDKSTRTTTVTFTDVLCLDWCTNQIIGVLNFTLERSPI